MNKEELFEKHYDWMVNISKKMAYLKHWDFDECIQEGWIGFNEACERYQEDKGASFRTFAKYRIDGAIIDAHRSLRQFSSSKSKEYDGSKSEEFNADIHDVCHYESFEHSFEELTEGIPKEYRDIFYLYYVKGNTMKEISTILSIPYVSLFDQFEYGHSAIREYLNIEGKKDPRLSRGISRGAGSNRYKKKRKTYVKRGALSTPVKFVKKREFSLAMPMWQSKRQRFSFAFTPKIKTGE